MTHDTTVRWTKFLNQGWAAIAHYKGSRNLYDISGNDTTQIRPGAVPISHDHINTSRCGS